jgi:hypothetical protein
MQELQAQSTSSGVSGSQTHGLIIAIGIGEFLLEKKYQSFFVNVGSTYMFVDLEDIKDSLTRLGKHIKTKGLPIEFAPYVFAVTSKGRVAEGALEILE